MHLSFVSLSPQLPGASIFARKLPLKNKSLIAGPLKQVTPLAWEMVFWCLRVGRRHSHREQGSWQRACAPGLPRLAVPAACIFRLSGRNSDHVISAENRSHRRSFTRTLQKLEVSGEQPDVSVSPRTHRAVSDQQLSLPTEMTHMNYLCILSSAYSLQFCIAFHFLQENEHIITTFPFSLGFLTFPWCRLAWTEKPEFVWALCHSDGISGGSSTFSLCIVSKSALPSYYPISVSCVKSHSNEFYLSLNCLCALKLQKLNGNIC